MAVPSKWLEEVMPSAELLAHYKGRIEEFESEREQLLQAVERCAVHQDEVHRLEWENRKRADEIRELQQALSDAQAFLFEERQRLLALQAENDDLKLQELDDRKRIQHLLAMTQPSEQEVGYTREGLPSSVTLHPTRSGPSSPARQQQPQQQQQQQGGRERVLRTVFLPTANADALMLKVESLQAQLNEQRSLADERVAALLADRRLREQEESRHRTAFQVQVEALSTKVKKLEDTLRTTTREYILARREKQEAEAAAAAAKAQMVAEVKAARDEAAAQRRQHRAELDTAKEGAEGRMKEYVGKFREQVRAREEELVNLASLHTSTKAALERRVEELEGRLSRLSEANRQLELRRALDCDGWTADVTLLRKALAAVDRKLLQMRLIDRLDDDERLDTLLDQLQKKVPSLPAQKPAAAHNSRRSDAGSGHSSRRGGGDDTGSISTQASVKSALAAELKGIKAQISQLEQRASGKRSAVRAAARG